MGTTEPVAFFGYPGLPSRLTPPGCRAVVLARTGEDVAGALESLAKHLGAPKSPALPGLHRPPRPQGALTPQSLGEAIAAVQPEGAIVMDEGATSGFPYFAASAAVPRYTYLCHIGGALGGGLPCATGAAVVVSVIRYDADDTATECATFSDGPASPSSRRWPLDGTSVLRLVRSSRDRRWRRVTT